MMPDVWASLSQSEVDGLVSPGVVQMVCRNPAIKMRTNSLGTLLATPLSGDENQPDIVMVTAHALTVDRKRCTVSYGNEQLTIDSVVQGEGLRFARDWAVLTLSGRFTDEANRLPWHMPDRQALAEFIEQKGEVLVMRHTNGETGRSCKTHIPTRGLRDERDEDKFIVADCTTFPGMSGAPVLAGIAASPRVIGINIGRRWDLSLGEPEWERAVNLIRIIDPDIKRAIDKAVRSASLTNNK